ncbi:MAG: hypothetical protein ACI8UO_002479 [Verrucomicrobiales bacterium]|jgi:hypothetical protein
MQIKIPRLLSFWIVLTIISSSFADEIEDAEALLNRKKYVEAAQTLTDEVLTAAEDSDFARYLRATARFKAEQFDSSIADCEAIPAESTWRHKAVFLKAENLIAQKNHGAVEEIYRAESDRLFAQERKQALAQLLINFADELRELPPNADSIPAERSERALALLGTALEIETGSALREEILYDKIILLRDTDRSRDEFQSACNDYLARFDPEWTEPIGEGRKREKDNAFAGAAGQHLWEVRMILFESVASNSDGEVLFESVASTRDGEAMRRFARKLLPTAPDAGELEWLLILSKQSGTRSVPVQGMSTLQKPLNHQQLLAFAEKYPDHGRAAQVAFTIANQLEGDEAIEAFQNFLKREDWPLPKLNRDEPNEPASKLAEWREQASFQIGAIRFAQGNYAGAIEQWRQYSKDFASGSLWASAQSKMVTAEFQNCLVPVDADDEAEARKRFDSFLTKYPLNGRVPQLLFLLGEFSFAKAAKLQADDKPAADWKPMCEKAIADWSTLIAKYPNSYEAKLARYRTGSLQTGPLEQFETGMATLKKLLEIGGIDFSDANNNLEIGGGFQGAAIAVNASENQQFEGGIPQIQGGNITINAGRNDSGLIYRLAKERLALLVRKSLSLKTDRVFRTNEAATVSLQLRNIEKVEISRYNLDLERYFRSHHRFDTENGIESLDIDLIQPDETWTVDVENFIRHKAHDLEIDARFEAAKPGVCLIRVEGDGWQASTVVLRSNIDLITQSTWREGLVFAQDSVTNEKVAGARVLVTNGEELIGEGMTNEHGIFRLQGQMIRDSANLCFYVRADQGQAIKRLNLSGMTQEITKGRTHDDFATLTKKGYLYTSKDKYRPGETVHVRGILREVENGVYTAKPGAQTVVSLLGPRGKIAREWRLPLSEFGTFETSFPLPSKAKGYFVIQAKLNDPNAEIYATRFEVRRPDEDGAIVLKFEFESPSVLAGEVIRGKLVVRQPWGDPVVDELFNIDFPDRQRQQLKTNAHGEIEVTQETAELTPSRFASFRAEAVHQRAYVGGSVLVQPAAFRLEWESQPEVTLAGEPLKFGIAVLSESGAPLAQKVDFEIEQLPAAADHGVLAGLPTISYHRQPKEVKSVLKRQLDSAPETGLAEIEATLEEPGRYRVIVSESDQAGNLVRKVLELEVEGGEDDSELRIFADETSIAEGVTLKLSIHSGVASPLALLTLGGAAVLESHPISLKEGLNELEIPIQAEHWPKFDVTVAFLHAGKLEQARRTFDVERELKIEIGAPQGPVAPGAEVEFSITTTNALGEPVAAEVSLGLSGVLADHDHGFLEMFRRGQRPGTSFRFGSTAGFQHSPRSRFLSDKEDGNDAPEFTRNHSQQLRQIIVDEHQLCAEIPRPIPQVDRLAGAVELGALFKNSSAAYRWSGPVVTGANGKATIKVNAPDSIGDWGVSVIGCSRTNLLGQSKITIASDSPIELRLKTPADLRAGDTWSPEALVKLGGGDARTLTLVSQIGEQTSEREIEIEPGRSQRVLFDSQEITDGEAISWSVRVGELVRQAEIQIRPRGVAEAGSFAAFAPGQIAGPAAAGIISATFHAQPEALLADLALGRLPVIPGIDNEPQTEASALLAATSALRLARARNLDSPELETRIETLILALQITQSDGGWSWQGVDWQRGSLTTSLGLWGLREAQILGFYVNEAIIEDGVAYLSDVLTVIPPEEPEKTAMVLFALALEDAENFSIANRLYRERDSLDSATLAFLAGTFLRMDRPTEAEQLLEVLLSKSEDGNWPGSERVARLSQSGDISAVALWSLAKAESPDAQKTANFLLSRDSAQSAMQGLWIAALSEHFLNQPPAAAEGEATLKLNGNNWVVLGENQPSAMIFSAQDANQISYERSDGILLLKWATADKKPASADENRALLPEIVSRNYFPSNLRSGDSFLEATSTSPVSNAEFGQILRVEVEFKQPEKSYRSFIEIEESIPAGSLLVPGSLSANAAKFEQSGNVLRITGLPGWNGKLTYKLAAVRSGTWSAPPTIIADGCRPERFLVGLPSTLTILPPGQKTPDQYEMNADERFELARLQFGADAYDEALIHLEAIEENHANDTEIRRHEREISRMLLWIHTTRPDTDAKRIVERFEALSERHADVVIPFDKIIKVAQAYKSLGELERSWLVYRAMIESNFINDATVAMSLKAQGDFPGYRSTQIDLWSRYPDSQDVLLAYLTLAQDLEENSSEVDQWKLRKDQEKPTKEALLEGSRDLLERFLTLYVDNDFADSAAFSLANVFFDLKDYGNVALRSEAAAVAYLESDFLSSFQYMAALGHFWKYQFPQALQAAEPVANGRTENAASARYVIAQVHQAQGNPVEAIDWYRKVRGVFPDAEDSLEYLEEKGVKLPDAVSFQSGEDVQIELSYRNIKEADIQVYKVDLMRLYSRQKDLANIANVSLAGISPEAELTVQLGEGTDYEWKTRELKLPIEKDGAYLLVCRGDSTFASGLALVTPLELKVREESGQGEIRLHLWDQQKKAYVADAEIKAFDSLESGVQQGRTDPRGAFHASGIQGYAAVVVKHGESSYAFHRSAAPLSPLIAPPAAAEPVSPNDVPDVARRGVSRRQEMTGKDAYFKQLKGQLKEGSAAQKAVWSERLEKGGKGVEASKAFLK